jgi:crotonobetaine/carnitine-CoA ligase
MWRGAVEAPSFLGGRTMVMIGVTSHRVVVYPIADLGHGRQVLNWVAEVRTADARPMPRQDWDRPVDLAEPLAHFAAFRFEWLDVPALIGSTADALVYPMVDREPLLTWGTGRVTLLGDAAHPMYPIGANGASQAILDARVMARTLAAAPTVEDAVAAYQSERLPATTSIVEANRRAGPERCMDIVAERAPQGFDRISDIITDEELLDMVETYRKLAGFDRETLNQRASHGVLNEGQRPQRVVRKTIMTNHQINSRTFDDIELRVPDRNDWVLGRILETRTARCGDRPFLQWEADDPLTYGQVNEEANRLAHGLAEAGVRRGDFVSILLRNSLDFMLLIFGLNKLGAIPAPVNTAFRGYFLELALNTCQSRAAVTSHEFLAEFIDSQEALPDLKHIYLIDAGPSPSTRFELRKFSDLRSRSTHNPGIEVRARDAALIQYTSGTTGPSKAVLLPNAQVHYFGEASRSMSRLADRDVSLNAFPMFHGNPLSLTVYPSLLAGGKAVLYERFSASHWARRMRAHEVTHTTSLGVTMDWIFKQPPRPDDETMLRVLHANPTAHMIKKEFQQRFKVERFLEAFGQTETGTQLLCPYDEERPPGAMGKQVADWYDIRIVDPETDEEVPGGQSGEMVVRPKVPWITCLGYHGNSAGTLRVMRNLWWHMGDRVRRDADGWFYFEDRTNDALRVKGENVSSYEVEQLMLSHEAIAMCTVVGVPSDDEGGEHEMKSAVVLQPGYELDFEEFIRFCERRLPWFAVPRFIDVLDDMPMNDLGKVRKDVVRSSGIHAGTWDRLEADVYLERESTRISTRGETDDDVPG